MIFSRLYANVWHRSGICLQTKLKVYRAVVLPVLLYASETWTVYSRHVRKLNHFHTLCLRKVLNIKWQDKIPNTTVLDRAGIPSIDTLLRESQIRWAGHVARMPDHRLPKIIFYGEIQNGRRSQGGQKKRFKDTLKTSLKSFGIDHDTWENTAQDRTTWRSFIRKGATLYETSQRVAAQQRRMDRKTREAQTPVEADIPCPQCSRTFRARIGLTSHLRTHN